MPESYCGLCYDRQLYSRISRQPWLRSKPPWTGCRPSGSGSVCRRAGVFPVEFRRGLDWFLGLAQCPGCKDAGGLNRCDIRECAQDRQQDHCHACSDDDSCRHLIFFRLPRLGQTKLLRPCPINQP